MQARAQASCKCCSARTAWAAEAVPATKVAAEANYGAAPPAATAAAAAAAVVSPLLLPPPAGRLAGRTSAPASLEPPATPRRRKPDPFVPNFAWPSAAAQLLAAQTQGLEQQQESGGTAPGRLPGWEGQQHAATAGASALPSSWLRSAPPSTSDWDREPHSAARELLQWHCQQATEQKAPGEALAAAAQRSWRAQQGAAAGSSLADSLRATVAGMRRSLAALERRLEEQRRRRETSAAQQASPARQQLQEQAGAPPGASLGRAASLPMHGSSDGTDNTVGCRTPCAFPCSASMPLPLPPHGAGTAPGPAAAGTAGSLDLTPHWPVLAHHQQQQNTGSKHGGPTHAALASCPREEWAAPAPDQHGTSLAHQAAALLDQEQEPHLLEVGDVPSESMLLQSELEELLELEREVLLLGPAGLEREVRALLQGVWAGAGC
ncbi:hypothetical protein ABPG75_006673 [Micractinium tetrahymenae]